MSIYLHGENGITYSFFSDINNIVNLQNLLSNIRWLDNEPKIAEIKGKFQIHLFPSFGRGRWGMGEPDGLIITDSSVFVVEIETSSLEKLPPNYFEQMNRFIQIGQYFEKSDRKKVGKQPISIISDKKVKGKYRTRKIIQEILKKPTKTFYYITITSDHLSKNINGISATDYFKNKIFPKFKLIGKHGLFSLHSINKLNFVSLETKDAVKFNLEK